MTKTIKVELRGAVRQLAKSRDPFVCVSGPAGTGKTFGVLFLIHCILLQYPGTRAVLLRKTHRSLTATTLETFRSKVAVDAIDAGIVSWFGGSGSEPAQFRYTNGSRLVVSGLDNPEKIKSLEVSIIVVDEATEITRTDFDILKTRLRGAKDTAFPKYRLILMTNPGAPTHWIKTSEDIRLLYSVHEDNPSLYRDDSWTDEGVRYLEFLESLSGVQYERLRHGRWVASDGIVYPEFDPNVHVIPRYEIPEDWDRYLVVDFGFKHPFAAQWYAIDGDGRAVMYREIYRTETLVEDHARLIKELSKDDPRLKAVIADHHAENRASLERHLGLSVTPAKKSVMDGIEAVTSRLRDAGDGSPRIFFMEDSLVEVDQKLLDAGGPHKTIDEFSFYRWDPKRESVVKEYDDALDCVRYMTAHLDLQSKGIQGVSGFSW